MTVRWSTVVQRKQTFSKESNNSRMSVLFERFSKKEGTFKKTLCLTDRLYISHGNLRHSHAKKKEQHARPRARQDINKARSPSVMLLSRSFVYVRNDQIKYDSEAIHMFQQNLGINKIANKQTNKCLFLPMKARKGVVVVNFF